MTIQPLQIKIQALARLQSLAAGTPPVNLKKMIALRTTYERLQDAIQKAKRSYSKTGTKKAQENFKAWKASHPGYPTTSLETLQKQARNAHEKKNPDAKKERKEGEKKSQDNRDKAIKIDRRLDDLYDELKDAKDKDYDYTPDDMDSREEYIDSIKKKIADAKKELKALK